MTIARVSGQVNSGFADNTGSGITVAFPGDVTAGNLVVVWGIRFTTASDAWIAADCTKSAGTATIDTPLMHRQSNLAASNDCAVGIFSAIVTGSGSLTMALGGAAAGSYHFMIVREYSSSIGWDASREEATNAAINTTGAPSSGDATSAGEALFVGGVATSTAATTTHTEDGAWTLVAEQEDGAHMTGSAIDRIVTNATTAANWTAPNTLPWAAAVAVLKEAVAGGIAATAQNLQLGHLGSIVPRAGARVIRA